ncbi:hypothetical protein RHSIM_Rhsim07G0103300 [Rhododendron simsii]|uniref:Uncharacterized protein n=1 Tax=Rhododendron simsii TaxID=118357 RepID=A0A834GPL1_RHOSS|nr:hypothetical protein RHSIM_Rhsim07G0103300 [Rhododendron simsii]
MGMTYAARAGDDVAPAGDEDGLTDADAERRQQARGGVQSAEAWHLVFHGLCHRATARLRRRAGETNISRYEGINMGVTFAAVAGDKIAAAGEENGLSDVDAEGLQQARGVVQVAEALHLVRHGLFQRAAARRGRRAGAVYVSRAGCQLRGARRLGVRQSGCHRHRHRRREN